MTSSVLSVIVSQLNVVIWFLKAAVTVCPHYLTSWHFVAGFEKGNSWENLISCFYLFSLWRKEAGGFGRKKLTESQNSWTKFGIDIAINISSPHIHTSRENIFFW